jgi:type IV pilus assembly protein PilW
MRADRSARAHTLLEVLIALSVGLLVLAAAGTLYHTQRVAQRRADDAFLMRDAASTALMLVGQHIQMAGFRPLDAASGSPFRSLFGCASGRVRGPDAQPWCESARTQSDSLMVRYVGDAVSTWPTAGGDASDCLGQGVGAAGASPFVSNRFDAHASPSTGEPELYCEGSGRPGVAQPVVAGIEQLRFRFLPRGATRFVDAGAMRADDWARVEAVHVCVRARGEFRQAGARYRDCDGNDAAARDGRGRLTLHRVIALRNASDGNGNVNGNEGDGEGGARAGAHQGEALP